jgi:hypothetical protein
MPSASPEIIPISVTPGETTVLQMNVARRMRIHIGDHLWMEIVLAANQDVQVTNPIDLAIPLRVSFHIEDGLMPRGPKLVFQYSEAKSLKGDTA